MVIARCTGVRGISWLLFVGLYGFVRFVVIVVIFSELVVRIYYFSDSLSYLFNYSFHKSFAHKV